MVDIVSRSKRSQMMAGIRSKNTKPEIILRSALHRLGFRFRLNRRVEGVRPDIVLPKYKVAIFVHGCFWHQHDGCKLAYSNRMYEKHWKEKFEENKARDKRATNTLLNYGWRVAVVWECSTRKQIVFSRILDALKKWILLKNSSYFELKYKEKP